ncbi:MAG: AAA domain-containing protein [Christensenellales bacterium]
MKKIYKYYKRRLIEISGKNRSLYSNRISNNFSYDIGKIFKTDKSAQSFVDFLWSGKKLSFEIVGKETKNLVYENLNVEKKLEKYNFNVKTQDESQQIDYLKLERVKKQELKKTLQKEVNSLKTLKRENEELEKETGRYELYVGYPFVEGKIGKDLVVKAPLLLFPVVIDIDDDQTASLSLKPNEQIKLNKVLMFAYANTQKLFIDDLITDFDDLKSNGFKSIADVVNYLKTFGYEFEGDVEEGFSEFKTFEPSNKDSLILKNYCVLGRYPLTNSIYNDYEVLERKNLVTGAIEELLFSKQPKHSKKENTQTFAISELDYAQQKTIENLNKNSNMVIYGPPGTGKSQTIVNIITDALTKGQKVLVVSQKKSALDVVYNRLGDLNCKATMITDSDKSKLNFYLRAKQIHDSILSYTPQTIKQKNDELLSKIQYETEQLNEISKVLFEVQPYGISLQQMYANSEIIGKKSNDYAVYTALLKNKNLMALNFDEIYDAVKSIKDKNKHALYYKFLEKKQINPLIDYIKSDIEMHSLVKAQNLIKNVLSSRFVPFDITKQPYARDLLAYYLEHAENGKINYKPLTHFIASTKYPKLYKNLKLSKLVFPLYPFARKKVKDKENEIESSFDKTLADLKEYVADYEILKEVLEPKGYLITCDNILSGNTMYLKLLSNALNEYVDVRDMNSVLKDLNETEKLILKFAYQNSDSYKTFKYVTEKIVTFRTYAEVVKLEDKHKDTLAKLADFNNIKNRLQSLKKEQREVNKKLCYEQNINEYKDYILQNIEDSKNFVYQISKQQNLWPIRKTFGAYKDFLLKLFPCWLLSPETASQILPLEKEMFDLVIFDEASQVFVENTLPCIYRGKHIVVAGDNKQLRPSTSFIKRYMGNEDLDDLDYSSQVALEVESLLDLATSRYFSSNLTYHYRSRSEELINFSNYAFYEKNLQISPNITKNKKHPPIERIKVDGKWIDTKNVVEAETVANLLCKLLKDKTRTSSIGIITFNLEQETAIEDAIDKLASKDKDFRDALLVEQNRKENGEDISLFVKNLENVQGDERDIIIFSTAYAKNEYGKVVAHFGLLSNEGGENRLNVAITRAKQKIYLVTSIEPEELNVDASKNLGPKLFREYLKYVRAVANGNGLETKFILNNLLQTAQTSKHNLNATLQTQLKQELEALGYNVELDVGNTSSNLPLAIYDKRKDKYLLGIEFDFSAYESSDSVLERDVYRPAFLQSRGWNIYRVWSRDWWLNKKKVLNNIVKLLQK